MLISSWAAQFHQQHPSHWLVETISQAYTMQGLPMPGGLVAHSTRSVATSWAALKGVALGDICAAASWSTPCTFTRFYSQCCIRNNELHYSHVCH